MGVLHDEPVGTSNGVIDGRRLFACPNKHGGFYAVHEIRVDKHADEKASGGVPKASGGIPQSTASPSGAVGDEAGPSVPCAATSVAAGRGLHTAVVAQLSQITITCNDAYGRRTSGGDSLSVIVRGDARTKYGQIRAVLDICQQANVGKVDLATEALAK